MSEARPTRSNTDKILAGVCGGLATYTNIDSVFIRLAFLILIFASGIGLPIYLILWVIMPTSDQEDTSNNAEVMKQNIEDMGVTLSNKIGNMGQPNTVGVVLMGLGIFFLFNQFGFISGGFFWPLVVIGLGVYLLAKRR
ncbi:MAG: PspC domain-containing protein [Chloroflexota bacterium]